MGLTTKYKRRNYTWNEVTSDKAQKNQYRHFGLQKYEGVSKSFRTESIKKYLLAFGITR